MQVNFLLGVAVSSLVAFSGYKKGALSGDGFWGALFVGAAIITFGGWLWFILLLAFFISSSILTRLKKKEKWKVYQKFDKGGERDFIQTLANGGLGAILAICNSFFTGPLWFGAYVGAMATVNADTWATELGVLSRKTPRLITSGSRVPPGTSGGITRAGFMASVSASLLIGFVALIGLFAKTATWQTHLWIALAALVSGTLGSLLDSFLGATKQAMFYCPRCGEETEGRVHSCGERTRMIRGSTWLNNDGVNLISSLFGAVLGALGAYFWAG